jgi:phage tail protein X
VKKNDRLLDIVAACNDKFQKQGQSKITMEQVLEANPGLKANHLVTGKKIIIPIPPKEAK